MFFLRFAADRKEIFPIRQPMERRLRIEHETLHEVDTGMIQPTHTFHCIVSLQVYKVVLAKRALSSDIFVA